MSEEPPSQPEQQIQGPIDTEVLVPTHQIYTDEAAPLTPFEEGIYNRSYAAARSILEKQGLKNDVEDLNHRLDHDELTGLLNRNGFLKKGQEAIARDIPFGVVFLDLTNFKKINDGYGHEAGDKLLKALATKLKANIRTDSPVETVAHERLFEVADQTEEQKLPHKGHAGRVGGDEFKLIIDLSTPPRGDKVYSNEEKLEAVLVNLKGVMKEFVAENGSLDGFDVSTGGALWEPGQTLEDVLQRADDAMYEHKQEQHALIGSYR